MKLQKHSPERALRPQAGVRSTFGRLLLQEPLHKSRSYTSPALGPLGRLTLQEGAAEGSFTPSGFMCNAHGSRGLTPACSLFRPSALRVGNFNY